MTSYHIHAMTGLLPHNLAIRDAFPTAAYGLVQRLPWDTDPPVRHDHPTLSSRTGETFVPDCSLFA